MKKICTGPMEFTPYRPWSNERRNAARERVRRGLYWIGERPAIAKRMWLEGATFREIADHLGGVSRSGVAGFIRRNGLHRKDRSLVAPQAAAQIAADGLEAWFDDCYWPASRMREVVGGTIGDAYDDGDANHRAGLFLFGFTLIGTNAEDVAYGTGLPATECATFLDRAAKSDIIVGGKINDKPWYDGKPDVCTISFILDCMVVAGGIAAMGVGPERRYSKSRDV